MHIYERINEKWGATPQQPSTAHHPSSPPAHLNTIPPYPYPNQFTSSRYPAAAAVFLLRSGSRPLGAGPSLSFPRRPPLLPLFPAPAAGLLCVRCSSLSSPAPMAHDHVAKSRIGGQIEQRTSKIERHGHHAVSIGGITTPMNHFAVQISSLLLFS